MLFNNLLDLIYFEKDCLAIEICEILIQILGDNTEYIIPNNLRDFSHLCIQDGKINGSHDNMCLTCEIEYNPSSPNKDKQLATINFLLENVIQYDLQRYYIKKHELTNNSYSLLNTSNVNINNFVIINKTYQNNFEVCHLINVYKYLMIIYFLDDNSIITFFDNHILKPNKGDLVIFPVAWFFVYKITKKDESCNNIYIYNNMLKKR